MIMNTSVQAKFSHASSHIVLTQDCVFLSIFIVIKTSENLVCPFVVLENERKLHTSFSSFILLAHTVPLALFVGLFGRLGLKYL